MDPVKLFISYSHNDELLRKELEKHLKILQRNGQISIWFDRQIDAGNEFSPSIDNHLKESQIILLLVSSDFIASDYCYEVEVKEALRLHEGNEAVVIPIILRECNWHNAPFGKLLALPTDGKSVTGKYWHNIDEAFTDIERGIEKVIKTFNENRKNSQLPEKTELLDSKTLHEAIEVFKIESEKLSFASTKDDFRKVEQLKSEIYRQLFQPLEDKIENTPKLKGKQPEELFNKIYGSEFLDTLIVQQINKIRDDKQLFKTYDRVLVISALTISILLHNRFDPKKANLLIDFLTDFEDNVWEHALVGIILGLSYHKNKWQRFNEIIKRLQVFQENQKIQNGLRIIEQILQFRLYDDTLLSEQIFSTEFFDIASNWFLPFYQNNPILENAIECIDQAIDIEFFQNSLITIPLPDILKYAVCLNIKNVEITTLRGEKNDASYKRFVGQISRSEFFAPFLNIISAYYNFLSIYPKEKHDVIFSDNLMISKTRLKDIIFNKANQLRLAASMKAGQENHMEAISNLLDLLKIMPNDVEAHWNIASSYLRLQKINFVEALNHLLIIEKLSGSDSNLFIKIGDCYLGLNLVEKAINYYGRAKTSNPKNERAYVGLAMAYNELDQHDNAMSALSSADIYFKNSFQMLFYKGRTATFAENYLLGEKYLLDSLLFCPKDQRFRPYYGLAMIYESLDNVDKAFEYAQKSLECEPKSAAVLMTVGRIYFTMKHDLSASENYLDKSLKVQKDPITYGNLGHIFLCKNDQENAFKYYLKSILGLKDEKSFIQKYNMDQKFVQYFNVSQDVFFKIRDEVVKKWQEIKSKNPQ